MKQYEYASIKYEKEQKEFMIRIVYIKNMEIRGNSFVQWDRRTPKKTAPCSEKHQHQLGKLFIPSSFSCPKDSHSFSPTLIPISFSPNMLSVHSVNSLSCHISFLSYPNSPSFNSLESFFPSFNTIHIKIVPDSKTVHYLAFNLDCSCLFLYVQNLLISLI